MSIFNTAVEKPITTLMIFVGIIVLGVFSLVQLPVDQYPKMDPPYLSVMTSYPGANAADIETNITKILEDQLNSVEDLKELTSTSYDNLSVIQLEFEWEANLDEAANDVRDAIDKAMDNLPDDIDRPSLFKFNTSMMPVIIYSFDGRRFLSRNRKDRRRQGDQPVKPGRRGRFRDHRGFSQTGYLRGSRSEQTGCLQHDRGEPWKSDRCRE